MENKDKAIGLFQYIKELYAIKLKIITDIKDQIWHQYINEIPNDEENIVFNYLDRTAEEDSESDTTIILQVQKPEFEKCPTLPNKLQGWVKSDWTDFNIDVKLIEKKQSKENNDLWIFFKDDTDRVSAFRSWNKERNEWVSSQRKIANTRNFFNKLYHLYIDLERDSESIELMVGQGMLHCTINEIERVYHPLLTKRLKLNFNSQDNILTIIDTDASAEIYTMLLDSVEYINHGAVKGLKTELSENFYHPLDRNESPDYLKSFAHRLHADGKYENNPTVAPTTFDKIIIYNNPVLFVRKRTGGVLKALEQIIDQISETGNLSGPILNLIGENVSQLSTSIEPSDLSKMLSSISGEDKDILLSKEANREQLEIARRIENYNAVLVQGPPGTGKTHTIANLMGHFLSQGKNILVTSHTKKALTVVKEKVVPELQNLCVAVLDDDNKDMERSVDGITDYISTHTSFELSESIKETEHKRNQILEELSETRKRLYAIRHKEYETITFGGKGYSVSEAARFVFENQEVLSYLPGKVVLYKPLPVTVSDLELLYQTNSKISIEEEIELNLHLPNPQDLISPQEFEILVEKKNQLTTMLRYVNSDIDNHIEINFKNYSANMMGIPVYQYFDAELANKLKNNLKKTDNSELSEWMANAVLAGKKGGGFQSVWDNLCNAIAQTYQYAGEITSTTIGKIVDLDDSLLTDKTITVLNEMKEHISQNKKFNALVLFLHKEWKSILSSIKINGKEIETVDDIVVVSVIISLKMKRNQLQILWDELIGKHGGILFSSFGEEPELSCISFVNQIEKYLNWYNKEFTNIKQKFSDCGFNSKCIKSAMQFTYPIQEIEYLMDLVYRVFPLYIQLAELTNMELPSIQAQLNENITKIKVQNTKSTICENLIFATKNEDAATYKQFYQVLNDLYQKYYYQTERTRILKLIAEYAPEWAKLIENRIGIHGETTLPPYIEDAWKWKQFSGIIDEITAEPFEELQHKSVRLNSELRKITAKLAESKSWYHLIVRIEKDLSQKQALQGWKLTTKKIGKGTGKNAPKYKKEAQRLMSQCQRAVPAWIMPVNKALESLDPTTNRFDIVIIDEASQSDISALAIFYLAKKIIVVGDDEQVSPSAVGVDIDKMNNLADMYIKGIVPNAHLYDMRSSLYDIAKTTFQPLMLKEHFRCVPDIIGYSNRLSYDYKIKPLRDDSNVTVKPATISFRVEGHRENPKINRAEAENIVALMIACMEQPEYKGMSFGAISLLGDEQAKLINNIAIEKISPKDYEKRRILCGNASHFQGDERDIIFLSLVDSNEGDGPLRMTTEGVGKSTKQRYNVAVSRAKNQLWVVHSLDSSNDLKSGDMRKDLIEYATNPSNFKEQQTQIKSKADSPFEISVASHLAKHGYHIVQQWPVGSYRIDMVAICGNKKIAIECDGELYHSGDDKVRADMERQAILERLGWRFIRIRGSEYYKNSEVTINRVLAELTNYEILPEESIQINKAQESDLRQRVISIASHIVESWKEENLTESEDKSCSETVN